MRPLETRAGGFRICSTAFASVLLPQPDSPARPSDLAGRDRERHAVDRAHRAGGQHVVDREVLEPQQLPRRDDGAHARRPRPRSSPDSISALGLLLAQPRIADLVESGEDEHERRHGQRERAPGEHERPPLVLQHGRVDLRPVQRPAPARGGQVAEPEELETGLGQDRDVEDEHERRGDPADHVRHQLVEDDPPARLARHLRGQDEVAGCSASAPAHAGRAPRTPTGSGPGSGSSTSDPWLVM